MSDLTTFRRRKDEFFKHDSQSPLTRDQQEHFDGLAYYPENEALAFTLAVEPFDTHEIVTMQTSTGGAAEYMRWGRLRFEVAGEAAELTVYASPGAGGYFLPFTDATSGDETYGAGRYLDIHPADDGRLHVDFNMAYNPYCAYNDRWTCPIPPQENRLTVPIPAGEKRPTGRWAEDHGSQQDPDEDE